MRSAFAGAAASAIVLLAILRTILALVPRLFFDVDPALDPAPFAGLGPAGSLALDAATLVACAIAWAACAEPRHRAGLLVLLALAPLPLVAWHGSGDPESLRLGSAWLAAAIGGATLAATLGGPARGVAAALLLAGTAPLLVRGAMQSEVAALGWRGPEHAAVVARFDRDRERILADRGWAPGSPPARIFERRLRQPQPTGWFVTTNVFATLVGAAFVALGGLALGLLRAGRRGLAAATAIPLPLLGLALMLTGSRGALGAVALGVAVVAAAHLLPALRRHARSLGLVLAAVPLLVLLGVVLRGALLPEGFAGDVSLLFRWHYLLGAARAFLDHPVLGVGPAGFQEAYVAVRPPRSPEEVASAHDAFADWMVGLGVLGGAWIALALRLAARAGAPRDDETPAAPVSGRPRPGLLAALALVAVGVVAVLVEAPALDGDDLVARFLALGAMPLLFAGILAAWRGTTEPWRSIALAGAVAATLAHGMIEMTWTQPGAAAWCWALLGVAAAGRRTTSRAAAPMGEGLRRSVAGLLALAALATLLAGWLPARRLEQGMRRAAAELAPIAAIRRASARLEAGDGAAAAELRRAITALGLDPTAGDPGAAIRAAESARRLRAAERLAALGVPDSRRLAARQYERAAALVADDAAARALLRAGEAALEEDRSGDDLGAWVETALLASGRAARGGGAEALDDAIVAAQRVLELDPHGLAGAVRLADLLAAAGRADEARAAYDRALAIDAAFSLDPLKQLPAAERARVEAASAR